MNVVIRDIAAPSAYGNFKIGKGSGQFGTPAAADRGKVGPPTGTGPSWMAASVVPVISMVWGSSRISPGT